MNFVSTNPPAGKSGTLKILSNSNAAYYKTGPMTQDAIHAMSLKASIPLLGISSEVTFNVEMQPFIHEPSILPDDIYYIVTTAKKSVSLTYSRHTGQLPYNDIKLFINTNLHDNSGGIVSTVTNDVIKIDIETNIVGESGIFTAKVKTSLGAYSKESIVFKIYIVSLVITPPTIPT